MRKAKITGCVAETVDSSTTMASIGVGFKVGRYKRYAQVGFLIETAKTDIDRRRAVSHSQASAFVLAQLERHP